MEDRWEDSWNLFRRDDPSWPSARQTWLAGSDEDRAVLLELLVFELMHGKQVQDVRGLEKPAWQRAQHEVRYFGAAGARALTQALHVLCERQPVDWVAVDRIGGGLVELEAVGEMREILADPKSSSDLRFAALRVVAAMTGDEAALGLLVTALKDDPDWKLRGKAVEGLEPWARRLDEEPSGVQARQALLEALEDDDDFVVRKSFEVLAKVRLRSARLHWVDLYAEALAAQDPVREARLYRLLSENTGRLDVTHNADAWRRAVDVAR